MQGTLTYKRSRRGDAEIDRAMAQVLKHAGEPIQAHRLFPHMAMTNGNIVLLGSTFRLAA